MKLKLSALVVLVLLLAGCGGSSSEGGTLTQAGEPSAGERGNLLLDTEVATYNLCIDLGIEPCGNEAGSVETTNAFIAQIEVIAADNQLKPAAVAASLSEASAEIGGACAECKQILDAKIATVK
ncbi:MAG: hypothetical protein H0T13_09790 [Actinobacteria bacterium]|nr:hypothetical protein [Actinomycetota bacterium]